MKTCRGWNFIFLIILYFFVSATYSQPFIRSDKQNFKNFYGIAWRGTAHDNLAYAKQMGYDYVFYQKEMETDSVANELFFYIESPEFLVYNRIINIKKVYNSDEINFYETHCSLTRSPKSFPFNFATSWRWVSDTNKFVVLLDFQQQKIISWTINNILSAAKAIEARNPRFHFGGFAWDEPRPSGDFWEYHNGKLFPASLKSWNGEDNGCTQKGIVHNYSTYTEGHIEFYKQLFQATRAQYPNAKFISEPYKIYEGWIKEIKDRQDAKEITPDILSQEGPGTQFVDDSRIYESGLIKSDCVFSTTPDVYEDSTNRLIMAKAALKGSWFGWFGRFGGTGDMPNFKNIFDVPARLQLIRVLSNWENRNGTPLAQRSWDGSIYQSKNAFASKDIIWAIQPYTRKLFVVFLTLKATMKVPQNNSIINISHTNNLFIEDGNGNGDCLISAQTFRPRNRDCLNKGYIIKLN